MEQFFKTEIKAIVAKDAFGKICNLVSFHVYNDIIEKKIGSTKQYLGKL